MAANQEEFNALIQGISDREARELCLDALRDWYKTANRHDFDVFGDLGYKLAARVLKRQSTTLHEQRFAEIFSGSLHYPDLAPFLDAIYWLIRAGALIPLGVGDGNLPRRFHVTRAGKRLLGASNENPLVPGYIDRLRTRCPNLVDDVVTLFADAHACFEHGLLRPAIALVGVGYEHAVEEVADALLNAQHITPPIPARAAARLTRVRAAIPTRFPGNDGPAIEARAASQAACDFADDLRRRRNDASHTAPRYGFDDRDEVEELLLSAGRHLPHLWAMR